MTRNVRAVKMPRRQILEVILVAMAGWTWRDEVWDRSQGLMQVVFDMDLSSLSNKGVDLRCSQEDLHYQATRACLLR